MLLVPRQELIQSVFALSPNPEKGYGSCLAYSTKGSFYLITAKHVMQDIPPGEGIEFYIFKEKWLSVKGTLYFAKEPADIAVIKLPSSIGPIFELELSCRDSVLGQDVYFLGFPYFGHPLLLYPPHLLNGNAPFPLVKKAILSSIPCMDAPFFLDCHNNPGFSGGPVVSWDNQTEKQKVLGVISAYIPQTGNIQNLPNNYSYTENSGIAIAYNINYAVEIIDKLAAG